MGPTGGDVDAFLSAVTPAARRRDAETLVALLHEITGEDPALWGSIVGFGSYHYRYASGREGDAPAAAFAPRKPATTIYLADGVDEHSDALVRIGAHTTGVGCLYLKDLAANDLHVLEGILRASYARVSTGGFGRPDQEARP